ncbi:MAG TPA: sugar-binding protein [Prolixibacteraceae bacterium]|nr:sugar-binding protein [Prolixibacteraceae bacterium]
MKRIIFTFSILFLSCITSFSATPTTKAQDKVVEAKEVETPPVIDGIASDQCWDEAKWQAIDQVWIPWGAPLDSSDFYGQYKICWSSEKNLLYFLVEITDDVVSDQFVKDQTAAVYNFDMIEVFIDENKSGGYHVFDGKANNEACMGTNAENAFVYHIFAKMPEQGQTGSKFYALDMYGTDWEHKTDVSYDWHFPEFKYRHESHVTTYEFSLMVFDDTYSLSNEKNSRVKLTAGKTMGLTLAANDDDQPEVNPKETVRDNMIGSVAVREEAYNDQWKNANDFGTVKLVPRKE